MAGRQEESACRSGERERTVEGEGEKHLDKLEKLVNWL